MQPKSFAGQTLATTLVALITAQTITSAFFIVFALRPEIKRLAAVTAQGIAAISDAAEASGPEARGAMIARLNRSKYIEVLPKSAAPPEPGPPPRLIERAFMRNLAHEIGGRADLEWRTDRNRRLWVRLPIAGEKYWVGLHAPQALGPEIVLLFAGLCAVGVATLAAAAMHRRIARPLDALTNAVAAVGSFPRGDFEVPHFNGAPKEVAALSAAFASMSSRLAATEKERALFLAGVSHDIRTPLSKLRLAISLGVREDQGASEIAHAQVVEIDRLLSQFLLYARGFQGEPTIDFDLDALVSEVVALRAVEGSEMEISGDTIGTIRARPDAIRRALLNLTENAVRHGKPPWSLVLARTGTKVEIAIRDNGAGVRAQNFDDLTKPFVRGGNRQGAGLGLAITDQVARLHRGRLLLSNIDPEGFEARLILNICG